ncbi:MAG: type II pantothenate kinase [Prevotella sp.]|nr:type II pantothenate kinase [Prevotella sp.]
MVIGIDVGISTTKIVGINQDGVVVSPIRIKATDPVTSLYGAFGKYLYDNKIHLDDIEHVMITGVGAAYIDSPIYGLPTDKAEEFMADGLGAWYEIGKREMIVVSMGTGTSLVQCDEKGIRHIGGIALGGGTLTGLSRIMLKTDDINQVVSLAMGGDLSNIDVRIGDISPNALPGLPKHATASLFGNARSNASREDIALGIITTVLQTIGSSCILASLNSGIREYVLIGNLTLLPQCKEVFPALEKLYKVRFIIPKYSEFCTAIGAALCYDKNHKNKK